MSITISQGAQKLPGRPGDIKMKCMIWQNQPICARTAQNEVFPLSYETLKTLPDYMQNALSSEAGVQGVWLKEQYVYHNNFLFVKNQIFESMRVDIQAYFDCSTLKTGSTPQALDAETPHFMWNLDGSLFDTANVTPSDILSNAPISFDPKYSRWTHEPVTIAKNADDNTYQADDQIADEAGTGVSAGTPVANTVTVPVCSLTGNQVVKLPPTMVFFPSQTAVGQATKWVATGTTQNPSGIHWKATKQTPIFQGEDFFVEFQPRSYSPNAQNTNNQLLTKYNFIDSRLTKMGNYVVNAGVVSVDGNLKIVDESRAALDLNSQPYYIIEMGAGTAHNYFIIIAQNTNPIFVHVSNTVPVQSAATGGSSDSVSITYTTPTTLCSRPLGIYKAVSSKKLMEDNLRIQIRQHLGSIVVTFAGHEDQPWIIERSDPQLNTGTSSKGPQDYTEQRVPMVIPVGPVSLYSGNMKVAWSFGPITYTSSITLQLPQDIVVKGPLTVKDLNMRLAEQTTYPNKTDPKTMYVYYQDAEEYHDLVNGTLATIKQVTVQPDKVAAQGKAPDKAANSNGAKNSYIEINMTSTMQSAVANNGGANIGLLNQSLNTNNTDWSQMSQYFSAQYVLQAGDYTFDSSHPVKPSGTTSGSGTTLKPWTLQNCITPIATGWRLYVLPAGCPKMPDAIDVSHHVLSFTDTWSPQDLFKIDHTGSISFLISTKQTGFTATTGADGGTTPVVDYSSQLAALHDKTFYIRIYAWWENGFMQCLPGINNTINCDQTTCNENNVIFTGFCHGGAITTESSTKKIMECQLLDYWKILQDAAFMNSPFFDGMRDFNAIYLIMQMAGFRNGTDSPLSSLGGAPVDTWAPLSLLKIFADSNDATVISQWPSSGCIPSDNINSYEYVLPSSYDILQSPNMKFADGTKFEDAIVQIAQKSGKVVFFDRWGVFHYENRKEEQVAQIGVDPLTLCEMNFYASPKDFSTQLSINPYQQVVGTYNYKANVADAFNIIHILASTPEGPPVNADGVNYSSIYDATQTGYIGYRKLFYQQNGIFGSQDAVNRVAKYYSAFFTPPLSISFSSFANGRLRALQLVSFSGLQNIDNVELNKQVFRLTSVNSTMEPANNIWMAKYEGEWEFFTTSLTQTS